MPSSETRPIDPKSITKQIGDRQLEHADRKAHASRTKAAHSLELPGGRWTPHDLRRTAATIMGELGVAPHVIDRCLNHREQNRITRTYQRQEMRQEQAEAWRLLGERLGLLTRTDAINVRTLPLRAA
jgi:integrase